ncbi:hypothetical protein HMPREF1573_01214 [Gardnerella vaginalis JCP7276]|nr:hypothetical protein HMPREF1573_01214 [Gardnerella vaginalis JCP7276]
MALCELWRVLLAVTHTELFIILRANRPAWALCARFVTNVFRVRHM